MRRRFARLPIHRKLVAIALVVTTAALVLATTGLMAIDLWRYRASAIDDTATTARIIAENTAAAVTFSDTEAASASLGTVRVRPAVRRACLYLTDGRLFQGFGRSSTDACPSAPPGRRPWDVAVGSAPVLLNGRELGTVYVERDLADIGTRVAVAALTGLVMLIFSGTLAFALAERLHRTVSRPIAQLASAARSLDPEGGTSRLPDVHAAEDEVGDLVGAFTEMWKRIREANARLVESNVALQREVDERRRMQAEREQLLARELEASRLKDEFLAAVSHELRTPLNAIFGWLHVLTTTPRSDQLVSKGLASLMRNAHAQNRVIEDLLDVSRIITGKLQLKLDAVDLGSVVESTIETTAPVATAKSVDLEAEVLGSPSLVHGDYDRLRQITWNLLSNAVKFTPAGGRVTVRVTAEPGAYTLSVIDTGVGIAPAFLPHVFERFRQADGSTTREYGGLGLGLAIVKELTELHGGTVHVASEGEGRGARFWLTLPALAGHPVSGSADAAVRLPRLDGVSVLVVDDNLDALDIVTAALEAAGATVRVAPSGPAAIELWREAPSDVLLCDLAMPGMDGFAVLARIRQMDPAGRVVPALAVTAYASDEYRRRSGRAGFQSHLTKPYDPSVLIRAVSAAAGAQSDV